MPSHRLRVIAILVAWAVATIGLIVLLALERTSTVEFGIVAGLVATLTPALVDAVTVERRRRDPAKVAVSDDVHPPEPPA